MHELHEALQTALDELDELDDLPSGTPEAAAARAQVLQNLSGVLDTCASEIVASQESGRVEE